MAEKKYPKGDVMTFSNWDKKVEIVRHGKRERYDKDIKAFYNSSAKSVQASVSDVTLDSLAAALKDRIGKLGMIESLHVKTVRDAKKKVIEVWLVKKEKSSGKGVVET